MSHAHVALLQQDLLLDHTNNKLAIIIKKSELII